MGSARQISCFAEKDRGKTALMLEEAGQARKKTDIRCYPMSSPPLHRSLLPTAYILICWNLIDVALHSSQILKVRVPQVVSTLNQSQFKKIPVLYHSWSSQILPHSSTSIILSNTTRFNSHFISVKYKFNIKSLHLFCLYI